MKGLILAAGRGSRLLPVSATRPKHTVNVAGVPIIVRAVRALREAGAEDIGIVTSSSSETELRDVTLGSGHLTFIRQPEALGTGQAVLCAREFLEGQDTLLYLGDNLFEDSLRPVRAALREADAVIGVKQVPDPQLFGVAVVEGGLLRGLVEKPSQPAGNLAACGVFAFRPGVLDAVAALEPSVRGEIEFPQALLSVIAAGGRVRAVEFGGFWSDAGTPGDLLRANAHYLSQLTPCMDGTLENSELSGLVVVEPGARVQNSRVTGPVWIGPHAVLRDSEVGPYTSVGRHALLSHTRIQGSMVDDFARVHAPTRLLERSIIGRHAVVGAPSDVGLQLVIGDRSVARL
ncbi:sugar phosphate nucleotidyltransferase [Deinococcus ficus]|uniref:sugar phosphate nucleotidyltransferase n=1 Tax=Deinococcus ficus TaxID=317577 RepID=UPI0003B6D767|nr:sugar phosphate nucleotidyltransferase [Deinococcus ficus]